MHYSADFCVQAVIVLRLLCESDVGELFLEIQSVSHLIEKEGKEEITPVLFKSEPPFFLTVNNTTSKLVALWNNGRKIAANKTSDVQEGMEPVLFRLSIGPQCLVVLVVHYIVKHKNNRVETLLCIVIELVELQTKEECIQIIVGISRGERVLQFDVAVIRTFLSKLAFSHL